MGINRCQRAVNRPYSSVIIDSDCLRKRCAAESCIMNVIGRPGAELASPSTQAYPAFFALPASHYLQSFPKMMMVMTMIHCVC